MASKNSNDILLEICVDNIESALIAERAGADRIELCQALEVGGLTPCVGLIAMVKQRLHIPVFMMIRPRSGNFHYTGNECLQMVKDIELGLSMEVDGFVTGALKRHEDGIIRVDPAVCRRLVAAANGKPVTFHRAFDLLTCSIDIAVNDIVRLGFARILTSGRATVAVEGLPVLRDIVKEAQGRIIIMPDETGYHYNRSIGNRSITGHGSGLSDDTVLNLYKSTKAVEYHSSGIYQKSEPEEPVNPIVVGATYHKTCDFFIIQALKRLLQDAKDPILLRH